MATLSLAMIVKNEEHTLARVLQAASQFCDELIVVDTGSTDDTVGIARKHNAQVHTFPWVDDFAAARNFSFSKCTSDWILWLDADDVLPPEAVEIGKRIRNELLDNASVDFIFTPYDYAKDAEGDVALAQMRERFMRRSANPTWKGRIHETICDINTKFIVCPEFKILHEPTQKHLDRKKGRNLAILEQYVDPETTTSTRDLYLLGGELRAASRHEEALKCYKRYHELWPKGQWDLFQEPYCVYVDTIDSYRRIGKPQEAVEECAKAIAMNPARAEAYALMGMTQFELGNFSAAFPLFLAAAGCKPPTSGGVVYHAFYSKHIKDMIHECKARIEETNGISV